MLSTPRLTLQPVSLELANELWSGGARGIAEPAWAKGYPTPGTMDSALMLIVSAEAGVPPEPYGMYQIIENETGQVVGDIGFHGPPNEDGDAEVGYGIVTSRRNRGYAKEALDALVEWAREDGRAKALVARTEGFNEASWGVLEGCGFVLVSSEGTHARYAKPLAPPPAA